MAAPLDVQRTTLGDLIVLRVRGDVDLSNVATLEDALQQACGDSAIGGRIVVETTAIGFLSVAGLTTLARAQACSQQRGLDFALLASQHAVLRPLQITGLDRRLKTFGSLEAATAEHPDTGR